MKDKVYGELCGMNKWKLYQKSNLPRQGENLIIIDKYGNEYRDCYRCGPGKDCMEIGTHFGGSLLIDPMFWKYDNESYALVYAVLKDNKEIDEIFVDRIFGLTLVEVEALENELKECGIDPQDLKDELREKNLDNAIGIEFKYSNFKFERDEDYWQGWWEMDWGINQIVYEDKPTNEIQETFGDLL